MDDDPLLQVDRNGSRSSTLSQQDEIVEIKKRFLNFYIFNFI